MQSSLAGLKKENGTLREQVKAKQVCAFPSNPPMTEETVQLQAENTTISQSVSRLIKESETTKAHLAQSEVPLSSSTPSH